MATIYRAPQGHEPPTLDEQIGYDFRRPVGGRSEYEQKKAEYLERLATAARQNGTDPILGEVIRFGVGDGYAEYVVWKTKPLQLIWVEWGDAWSIRDAEARGLRLTDVRRMVEADRKLAALFGRP